MGAKNCIVTRASYGLDLAIESITASRSRGDSRNRQLPGYTTVKSWCIPIR
jgi:hypothetical protein